MLCILDKIQKQKTIECHLGITIIHEKTILFKGEWIYGLTTKFNYKQDFEMKPFDFIV